MPSEDATVHVIDDDQAARDSLAFLLKAAKLAVKTYESARVFLDVATGIKSGCIITDVRMPEIDGIELLRRLKLLKVTIPVIVVTGHGDVPLAVEARARRARRARGRARQQADCVRPRHQPAHGRNLQGQPDAQDAGVKPFQS